MPAVAMTLRDPETCPRCARRGQIIESKKRVGYRRRVYHCRACRVKWLAFLSVIHPRKALDALLDRPF